jgi:hypothetical protein
MTADQLIESQPWIMREIKRSGMTIVSLGNADYRELVGFEFCRFFFDEPFGRSEKYNWEMKKVDELRNLYIWKNKEQK